MPELGPLIEPVEQNQTPRRQLERVRHGLVLRIPSTRIFSPGDPELGVAGGRG